MIYSKLYNQSHATDQRSKDIHRVRHQTINSEQTAGTGKQNNTSHRPHA